MSFILEAMLFPGGIRDRAAGQHTACRSNLRNCSVAIDLFTDETKRRPAKLESLTPNYLRTLPTCPAAGRMSYAFSSSPQSYRISCEGRNHTRIYPDQEDVPFWDSETELNQAPPNPLLSAVDVFVLAPFWLPLLAWLLAIPLGYIPRLAKGALCAVVAAAATLNFPLEKSDNPWITLAAGVVGMALVIASGADAEKEE